MEAKEIVSREVARQAEFGMEPSWVDFVIAGRESGLKEVVEWIRLNATDAIAVKDSDTSQQMTIRAIPNDNWQAKLKEWGITLSG